MWIVTYLLSRGKAFCSLCENPLDCFAAFIVVGDGTSSTDSERFLFLGADVDVVDVVRWFWGKAKSPSTVVIAECALLRVEPNARSGCFNQLFLPYEMQLCTRPKLTLDVQTTHGMCPKTFKALDEMRPMRYCTKKPPIAFSWSLDGVDDPRAQVPKGDARLRRKTLDVLSALTRDSCTKWVSSRISKQDSLYTTTALERVAFSPGSHGLPRVR